MTLMQRWCVPGLTVVLLGGMVLAQDKLPPSKYRQQEIEALRQKVKEMEAKIARLQAQIDAKRKAESARLKVINALAARQVVKPAPVAVPNAIIRLNARVLQFSDPTPANPIMKGEYRKALDRLGRIREELNPIEEPAKARQVLDKMNRALLDVRRTLWEIEQKQPKEQDEKTPSTEAKPQPPAAGAEPPLVGRLVVGNEIIRFGAKPPANPLLTGEYKKALDKFAEKRKKLDRTEDPVLARKVVDNMDRLLLDARRALWEREKAEKAKK